MATRKPIVVIGSINLDLVCRTSHRPAPGETVLGTAFSTVHGGKGANQAVAAARLGAEVNLIGRLGDDAFGRELLASLQHNGVNTVHVKTTAGVSSGVAAITVDDAGENSIIVVPGANARLTAEDIDAAEMAIAGASCVMLQLETPYRTIEHAIAVCRRLGVYTILDPAPAPDGVMPQAFYEVDLLTPNQSEARAILGMHDEAVGDREVGERLLNRGARRVILKLGSSGAMLLDRDSDSKTIAPFPVSVVDSTAAGDAFNAAVAVGLSEQMEMTAAIRFANAAGALACMTLGAQPSLPTRDAVEKLLSRK